MDGIAPRSRYATHEQACTAVSDTCSTGIVLAPGLAFSSDANLGAAEGFVDGTHDDACGPSS